jgi:hypothetical protein
MNANNRLAVFCLAALALLIFGLMVENYWDCRRVGDRTEEQCGPLQVRKWGMGHLPVQILPQRDAPAGQ